LSSPIITWRPIAFRKSAHPSTITFKDGFYAATRPEELKCPDLEAKVLIGMEDVSNQVKDAAKDGVKASAALEKRNAAIARIEKTCADKPATPCTVVKLFAGQRFDLYRYKKYTDLRLVFAPEFAIAFSAAIPITSPTRRYDLDIAFLRAYEDGQPAATPHYLKWSAEGVQDAALVFVAGNPAATSRLDTAAELAFLPGHFPAPDPDAFADAHTSLAHLLGPERRETRGWPSEPYLASRKHLQRDGRQAHRLERCHA